jgi:hypothetical protein
MVLKFRVAAGDSGFSSAGGTFSRNAAARPIITTTKMIDSIALLSRLSYTPILS